jgi:hypothetical protein
MQSDIRPAADFHFSQAILEFPAARGGLARIEPGA